MRTPSSCLQPLLRSISAWLPAVAWATVGACLAGGAVAGQTPELVKAMLENAPASAEARCSYTRTRVEGDQSRRERFQAEDVEAPWKLLSVDGRDPRPGEMREYTRQAGERDRRHPLAFDLRGMVDPAHWYRVSETAEQVTFRFRLRPNDDVDERLVDKVQGTLVVDRQRQQPVRIRIENTEPAYVAPLVRVAEYRQDMEFRWDEAVGAAVLSRTETHLRGRALGLKALREHKVVRYSDYQCRPAVGTDIAESGD